mgnify:CR=1 FL=1
MEMIQDGVRVYCLPDGAVCRADEEKRSPLDIDVCPFRYEICTGDCDQYDEIWGAK